MRMPERRSTVLLRSGSEMLTRIRGVKPVRSKGGFISTLPRPASGSTRIRTTCRSRKRSVENSWREHLGLFSWQVLSPRRDVDPEGEQVRSAPVGDPRPVILCLGFSFPAALPALPSSALCPFSVPFGTILPRLAGVAVAVRP
jgi:hypothetical protein